MNIFELDESLRTENPCWKGYHPVGTKKKNGRTVPNCVPNAKEDVSEVSAGTEKSYKEKAEKQIKDLEPHAKKGEYRDIAQRAIDRRQKGLKRVSDRQGVAEGDDEKIGGRYNPDEFDSMVRRLGQRSKQGPLKTVYDIEKKVYKNVPANTKDRDVDEASLATMRDYFAGNKDAQDPTKVAQMRNYFAKQGVIPTDGKRKEFRSQWEYQQWLNKNKLRLAAGLKDDVNESTDPQSNKNLSESLLEEFQTFLSNDH